VHEHACGEARDGKQWKQPRQRSCQPDVLDDGSHDPTAAAGLGESDREARRDHRRSLRGDVPEHGRDDCAEIVDAQNDRAAARRRERVVRLGGGEPEHRLGGLATDGRRGDLGHQRLDRDQVPARVDRDVGDLSTQGRGDGRVTAQLVDVGHERRTVEQLTVAQPASPQSQ
jgi:hypothetical protein